MGHAVLSIAEKEGWRRYFDSGVICPECMAQRQYTPETWGVPPTYDRAIAAPERCGICRAEAPPNPNPDHPPMTDTERAREIAERECPECGGCGYVTGTEARCCGKSDWECGGRGCTGPEPEPVQEQCEYCRGSGTIELSDETVPPFEEQSNAR